MLKRCGGADKVRMHTIALLLPFTSHTKTPSTKLITPILLPFFSITHNQKHTQVYSSQPLENPPFPLQNTKIHPLPLLTSRLPPPLPHIPPPPPSTTDSPPPTPSSPPPHPSTTPQTKPSAPQTAPQCPLSAPSAKPQGPI